MLDGRDFCFLELNGRIQVEHPVTEPVTGVDLVREQLRIAAGERLALGTTRAAGPRGRGAALRRGSAHVPAAGRDARAAAAADAASASTRASRRATRSGTSYDPMIAKLIAHGPTRDEALDRLADALAETEVAGVTTNLPFLRWLVAHPVAPRRRGDDRLPRPSTRRSRSRRSGSRRRAWRGGWRLNLPAAPPAPPPDVDERRARPRGRRRRAAA